MASLFQNRTKLIVALVLGVLLVAVLLWDPGASEDSFSEAPAAGPSAGSAPAPRIVKKPAAVAVREGEWPKIEARDAETLNPFDPQDLEKKRKAAVVAEAPAPAEDEGEPEEPVLSPADRMKAAFANKRVRMVCRTQNGVIGLIDDQILREGDVVDGVRIVSIRPDGVLVEPVDE